MLLKICWNFPGVELCSTVSLLRPHDAMTGVGRAYLLNCSLVDRFLATTNCWSKLPGRLSKPIVATICSKMIIWFTTYPRRVLEIQGLLHCRESFICTLNYFKSRCWTWVVAYLMILLLLLFDSQSWWNWCWGFCLRGIVGSLPMVPLFAFTVLIYIGCIVSSIARSSSWILSLASASYDNWLMSVSR